MFSKNQFFNSLILCSFLGLDRIDLGPDIYTFSLCAGLGFGLLLLFLGA
jgi:hypothetical protein